jgi:ELWxxDGT repeat protein
VGNTLFFGGSDVAHGYELWKTDGTAASTVMVKDINAGTNSSLFVADSHGPPVPPRFSRAAFKNKLFFTANDGPHGYELWVSDGTDAGTVILNDLAPGSTSGTPSNFVVSDSSLYFLGSESFIQVYPDNIYVTNGLSCGTRKITSPVYNTSAAKNLTVIGSKLYVSLNDVKLGQEPFIIEPSQVPPPPDGCGTAPPILSQPTALVFSDVTVKSMTVSFSPSVHPGAGYITLMRTEHSPFPDDAPVDGISYQAGNMIGSSIVVGVGPETTRVVEHLDPATTYYFDVFAYKSNLDYLTLNPLAGSQSTIEALSQPTALTFSDIKNKSMTISFTPASKPGAGYITLMRAEHSPYPDNAPVDGTTYTAGAIIGSSVVIGVGTATSWPINHLDAETTYYFDVFTYDSTHDYLTVNPLAGSQRTGKKDDPEIASVSVSFPKVTANAITLSITPSDPAVDGYITLMKTSAPSTDVPQDGNAYQTGSVIGSSVVVGFGKTTDLDVKPLNPGTEYFFTIYPYKLSGSSYDYVPEGAITAKQKTSEVVTAVFSKEENIAFPNPFTDVLTIRFFIATDNTNVHVILYDKMGRIIADVVNDNFIAGNHEVHWDRTDNQGNKVQAGLYIYHVSTSDTGKVTQGLVVAR